jgi:kinesin family protein 3/17
MTGSVGSKNMECVKVVVRCRPLNQKEVSDGHTCCVDMFPNKGLVEIKNPSLGPTDPLKTFTFDAVYDCNSKQTDLYAETFAPLVDSVLDGFNGTIFAYGQTGTGKTYTMEGVKDDPGQRGVIPNSFDHVFSHIAKSCDQQYLVRASYLEIYLEDVRDLLAKDQTKNLELKERPDTGVYVKDLSSFVCKSVSEIEHVMAVGNQNRSVGKTEMNEHSSRSHAIFIITVECSELDTEGQAHIRVGKLNLVDLAGSERQAKTGAVGERLKEATKINLSLSALGNVIASLVDGKSSHIPYRDSKLTRLLQDSLGGNARTVMVANLGPASYNYEETVTTLRFANRAKNIKNKPRINEDPKDALLREFQQEIARLKAQINEPSEKKGPRRRKKITKNEPSDQSSDRRIEGVNGSGDAIEEGDDSEGDNESEEDEEEASMKEIAEKLATEKELLESDTTMIAEEKEELLVEVRRKEAMLIRERAEKDKMVAKIKAMESKLLTGGEKTIVDHTNEQQRALEQRRAEVAARRKTEIEVARKLEEQEEKGVELEKTYSSLQQEVEIKTRKLRKLFTKLQSCKQDIVDVTEEYNRDRRDLELTQEELLKELKLKYLIIENFVPGEEKERVLARAQFDEEEDAWRLGPARPSSGPISKRPVSAAGSRRPVSEYARMLGSIGGNPRYRGENIMRLNLDHPARTTRDYEGPSVAPRVQAALDAAMNNIEEDIDIDALAISNAFAGKGTRKEKSAKKAARPKSSRTREERSKENYPESRGLVPK